MIIKQAKLNLDLMTSALVEFSAPLTIIIPGTHPNFTRTTTNLII